MKRILGGKTNELLRHLRKRRIKTWQIALLLVLTLLLSGFFLRQNNLEMIRLRNSVIQADESGGDTTETLKQLNQHVFNHMNTQIVRPVELVGAYNRQVAAIVQASTAQSSRNLYAEAAASCERRGVPLTSVAQCAADYVMTHNSGDVTAKIVLPDKGLFTHTFATPLWTADLAGWSIVASILCSIWLLARVLEFIVVAFIIRRRSRSLPGTRL